MSEFSIIQRYFKERFSESSGLNSVLVGIGDDAAVVDAGAFSDGQHLVTCVDTLVSGVHFPVSTSPYDIAYKAVAVNLSDMAAMGAVPRWMTLSLTMQEASDSWLAGFSEGLAQIATRFGVSLIGGDTTQGALTVSVQLMGVASRCLTRSGARAGQLICVSGELGAAALGLQVVEGLGSGSHDCSGRGVRFVEEEAKRRLNRPEPRLALGQRLLNYATSCIDISDGLLGDLEHICKASGCAADLELDRVPVYPGLLDVMPTSAALRTALTFGDDYELLFTLSERDLTRLLADIEKRGVICPITSIGRITEPSVDKEGSVVLHSDEWGLNIKALGAYEHFRKRS